MVKPALSTNRYVGGWPKIGIRPAIDGRRNGVRESLEGQTMGLARAAAEFQREPAVPGRSAGGMRRAR